MQPTQPFVLHAAPRSRVRLAPPNNVIVEITGRAPLTMLRFEIALCQAMLVRVYRERHDAAFAAPDPEAIVIRFQLVRGPVQLLGPFPHAEGLAIAAAIELSRCTVLFASPGFSVHVAPDETSLVIKLSGLEVPVRTAILGELRVRTDVPAQVAYSIPTNIPPGADTRFVEFAFLTGAPYVLGPLPRVGAEMLAAEMARWRAQRPIDYHPIPVDPAVLFADPVAWHGRRIDVVAPWQYGLERSRFGPAWLSVPAHAPVSEGSYRVRVVGTWVFPRLGGNGYGHMGMAPGELQAETIEILESFEEPKRDQLTGLDIRAAAGPALERVRDRRPVAVAMLDLDHFKRVNDYQGHEAGDQLLRAFAKAVIDSVRPSDILIRWRADEIVAIMPYTPIDQARLSLERACARLPGITASVGLVELAPGESSASVFERVDQTLYDAQRQGRNRIVVG